MVGSQKSSARFGHNGIGSSIAQIAGSTEPVVIHSGFSSALCDLRDCLTRGSSTEEAKTRASDADEELDKDLERARTKKIRV